MNGGIWFAVGGLSTISLIYILLKIGDWIKVAERKKEVIDNMDKCEKLLDEMIIKEKKRGLGGESADILLIMKNESEILCSICKQRFEKGSHWLVFGKIYDFCFRCGLEGEIEKFVKAEYAKVGYEKTND